MGSDRNLPVHISSRAAGIDAGRRGAARLPPGGPPRGPFPSAAQRWPLPSGALPPQPCAAHLQCKGAGSSGTEKLSTEVCCKSLVSMLSSAGCFVWLGHVTQNPSHVCPCCTIMPASPDHLRGSSQTTQKTGDHRYSRPISHAPQHELAPSVTSGSETGMMLKHRTPHTLPTAASAVRLAGLLARPLRQRQRGSLAHGRVTPTRPS